MAASALPPGGLSLHGAPNTQGNNSSVQSRSAILLHLNDQVIKDIRQCSQAGKSLQILAGKAPRVRVGNKTIDLKVTPEDFRHELYTSDNSSPDLSFTALVAQRAELKSAPQSQEDTAGADAALAALKQSLASYKTEKEAKQATISTSVLTTNKQARPNTLHPPRHSLLNGANRSYSNSPSLNPSSTTALGTAPTSTPAMDPAITPRMKAMRMAIVHLLAVNPEKEENIQKMTRTTKSECAEVLRKIGDRTSKDSEWQLSNKGCKDLDVWNFPYKTDEERQKAIDNAIRAYDRMRVARQDILWQRLLPKEERGKGKVLSRLRVNGEESRVGTPAVSSSPMPAAEGVVDKHLASTKGTPVHDSTSTPKAGLTGRGGLKIDKILKDSKKKHAAEEAKERKRKEKETAASDRETTKSKENRSAPRTTKKNPAKITGNFKSAEVVHSSDEEEEGEISEVSPVKHVSKPRHDSVQSKSQHAAQHPSSEKELKKVAQETSSQKAKPRSSTMESSESSDVPLKASHSKQKGGPPKDRFTPSATKNSEKLSASSAASKEKELPSRKETPLQRPVKKATTGPQKTQLSPEKADTKPHVPSPLGVTRPRNASEASERPASSASFSRPTKPTPSPLETRPAKQTNGVERVEKSGNADAPLSTKRGLGESDAESSSKKKVKSAVTNGLAKTASSSDKLPADGNTDNHLKRKANDLSSHVHDHAPATKHRKLDSHSTSASSFSQNTTARTSPDAMDISWDSSGGSNGNDSPAVRLSWDRALDQADKFKNEYYPAYIKLYDRLQNMREDEVSEEDRRKLWRMHTRLRQMKREIRLAAE